MLERIVERLFLVPTRALVRMVRSTVGFAFRICIHFNFSDVHASPASKIETGRARFDPALLRCSSSFRFFASERWNKSPRGAFYSPPILSAIERVDFAFVGAAPICLSVAAIMSISCGRSSRVSAQLSRRKAERPADEYFGEIHEIRR